MKEDKIALGFEAWKKVITSPLYRQIEALFRQIFKIDLVVMDIVGLTRDELNLLFPPHQDDTQRYNFCRLIWNCPESKKRCRQDGEGALRQIPFTGKIEMGICHAGLTEIIVPIMFKGKYCGALTTAGGLITHEPTQTEFDNIANRLRDTGIDLESLKKAYFKLNNVSPELLDVMFKLINIAIEEIIRTATEIEDAKKEITQLNHTLEEKYRFGNIIGKSKPMQEIFRLLELVSQNDNPVLIHGETGTGKELVARAIHYNSLRKDKPFVTQNCAAINESLLESELFGHVKGSFTGAIGDKKGLFELANNGTLFLDEIGEMSVGMQSKLLRAIEQGEIRRVGDEKDTKINVRIISATNKDLKELIREKQFREDLYYRLQGFTINLPPLRERKEDISLLIDHFLEGINKKSGKQYEVNSDALKLLMDYDWPGNVRELKTEIDRNVTLAKKSISIDMLSHDIKKPIIRETSVIGDKFKGKALEEILESVEKEIILKALRDSNWNKASAARLLKIPYSTLDNKIKKYGLTEK
jgi:transcriptional regulator with GAF, ATPase, and Fis domain